MKRDIERLNRAAAAVQQDLRRTTDRPWTCSVKLDLILTLDDGVTAHRLVLAPDVEDEVWFLPNDATAQDIEDGLIADAIETVADCVLYLLEEAIKWPDCPDHPRWLTQCSGTWNCDGPPEHSVEVGQLGA